MKILEIARQIHDRIPAAKIDPANFVSTDNMKPWFGGYEPGTMVPSGTLTSYQTGDILLSNIRPYFRKTWLATHDGGCNADVLCIRANESQCVPEYLYYVFCTNGFVEDYLKGSKGAKMPRGDINRLLNYEIRLPKKADQLRIAGLLGSLDEKIAICRKKITELETIAKLVYERWFVEFNFPDANGRPYKSNNGKMVWNEILKRDVPVGWEVKQLGELAEMDAIRDMPRNCVVPYVTTENLEPNMGGYRREEKSPTAIVGGHQFMKNDVLISNIRPYFQKIWFADSDGIASSDIIKFHINEHPSLLFFSLARSEFFDYVTRGAKGSKMPRGDKGHIARYVVSWGTPLLRKRITLFLQLVLERFNLLAQEINRQGQLRDELLPLLMNGQVEVAG